MKGRFINTENLPKADNRKKVMPETKQNKKSTKKKLKQKSR